MSSPDISDGEIQALLYQRLRLICLIFLIGWGLTWTHKFFRLQMTPDTVWFIMVPGGVLLAFTIAMAATLWAPRSRSLRCLRGYELVCYAVPMAFLLWENYFTIYRSGDMGGWVHRYVQREGERLLHGDLHGHVHRRNVQWDVHGQVQRGCGRDVQRLVQRDMLVHPRYGDVQRPVPRHVHRNGEPSDVYGTAQLHGIGGVPRQLSGAGQGHAGLRAGSGAARHRGRRQAARVVPGPPR